MTTKTIPLAEAGQKDLIAFAKNVCGLTLGFGELSLVKLRAKISECGYDSVTVEQAAEQPAAPPPQRRSPIPEFKTAAAEPVATAPRSRKKKKSSGRLRPRFQVEHPPAPKKLRIIVARSNEAGGDEPVKCGVNGKAMLIPRGEPVDVPAPYVEVLENAIAFHYEQRDLGGGLTELVRREVPLYPFQILGPSPVAA